MSPQVSPQASESEDRREKQHSDRLRGLVQAMMLPTEVLDLFARFEFEVCLLLRLLSQKPEQRPSAIEMRDALCYMLEKDGSSQHNDEVQKLQQEVAELKKIAAHNSARGHNMKQSFSDVNLRSYSGGRNL